VDSSTTASSREAQAEIRNTTAKSETAYAAKRGIIGTNLTSDTLDASRTVSRDAAEGRPSRRSRSHRRTRLALSFIRERLPEKQIEDYLGSATIKAAKSEARTGNG
jgi:hypothetical protein